MTNVSQSQNNHTGIENILQNYSFVENSSIGNRLSDFEILQILGENEFGFVAKVKSKKNLKIYAMKNFDYTKIERHNLKYYLNESTFMKKLDNPNICKLYTSFKGDDNKIYMIIEYMDNGNLFTFLNSYIKLDKKIEEEKLWNIFEQCLKALKYIHSKGLIHRDIKPANLLLNNKGEVKLSNFGVSALVNIEKAKLFTTEEKREEKLINQMTKVGSGSFQAPEINDVENLDNPYDDKIDVYSMGVTFCTLAFFQVELPEKDEYYSKELINIIKEMTKKQNERPNSSDIYKVFMKAYLEKYFHSTGLISCINCLYLYYSKNNNFLENLDDNISNHEISSQLNIILKALPDKKSDNEKSFSQLIYEFRELLYKKGLKIYESGNNEIEPISIINFLLKKMHKELIIKFDQNIQNNGNKVESQNATNIQSNISNNFYGLYKIKRQCNECFHPLNDTYNNFSYIPIDINLLINKNQNQNKKELNIKNALEFINKHSKSINGKNLIYCGNCHKNSDYKITKKFYNLPKNLIIFFDRGENCQYKNFVNFEAKLKFDKNNKIECFQNQIFTYDLLGIICRNEKTINNYSKKTVKESYTSYEINKNNTNKYINSENKQELDLNQIKKNGDVMALFYYCNDVKPVFDINPMSNSNLNNNPPNNNNIVKNNNNQIPNSGNNLDNNMNIKMITRNMIKPVIENISIKNNIINSSNNNNNNNNNINNNHLQNNIYNNQNQLNQNNNNNNFNNNMIKQNNMNNPENQFNNNKNNCSNNYNYLKGTYNPFAAALSNKNKINNNQNQNINQMSNNDNNNNNSKGYSRRHSNSFNEKNKNNINYSINNNNINNKGNMDSNMNNSNKNMNYNQNNNNNNMNFNQNNNNNMNFNQNNNNNMNFNQNNNNNMNYIQNNNNNNNMNYIQNNNNNMNYIQNSNNNNNNMNYNMLNNSTYSNNMNNNMNYNMNNNINNNMNGNMNNNINGNINNNMNLFNNLAGKTYNPNTISINNISYNMNNNINNFQNNGNYNMNNNMNNNLNNNVNYNMNNNMNNNMSYNMNNIMNNNMNNNMNYNVNNNINNSMDSNMNNNMNNNMSYNMSNNNFIQFNQNQMNN